MTGRPNRWRGEGYYCYLILYFISYGVCYDTHPPVPSHVFGISRKQPLQHVFIRCCCATFTRSTFSTAWQIASVQTSARHWQTFEFSRTIIPIRQHYCPRLGEIRQRRDRRAFSRNIFSPRRSNRRLSFRVTEARTHPHTILLSKYYINTDFGYKHYILYNSIWGI